MKAKLLLMLAVIGFLTWTCSKKQIVIFEDGISDYEISYDAHSKGAAETLQKYFYEVGNVKLPLVNENSQSPTKRIHVGLAEGDQISSNQIIVKTQDQHLYIQGGSASAIQNAVYEFLEKYVGCRWYAPDAPEIPSKEKLTLKHLNYTYTPEITTRTVHSKLFYDNPNFADWHRVTPSAFPNYVASARVHTFHKFMPEEKFYKEHPEYYALRNGKRLPTQLCLTNEKVLQIVTDSVASLFEQHPKTDVISVSQDDNQQYCQCDECAALDEDLGGPSGSMVHFVNQVAKKFPNKTISTLAYQYTRKPPNIIPEPNVLITLCSIECDRSAPISENCTDFSNDLIGWGKLTDNIRIWDYTTQFTNFLAPFPNLHTLQPNIQLFKDNNAKWIFEQHSHNPSELFELRSYITAKLLWDPNLNFDELLTEFTNGYYKEAGPFIKKYIETIHAEIDKDPDFFLFLYGDPSEAFSSFLRPELLKQYSDLFDEAEKAVSDRPELANRVKMARLGIDYATLEASRKNISEEFSLTIENESGEEDTKNPRVLALLDRFRQTTLQNGITAMNEMRFTVDEYYQNYLDALTVATKPNKAKGKKVTALTNPKKYAGEDPMVLTDGALGGSSFYANWLGYEGNDMEVVVDLGKLEKVNTISMAFLQVTNHIVFFPSSVSYYGSTDNNHFNLLGIVPNKNPLSKTSKVNDIKYYDLDFEPRQLRYIKVVAKNTQTPYWHHAAGLPSWVFSDEIIVN